MTYQLNCSLHSAPKARDVKAWANGPGNGEIVVKALKARNKQVAWALPQAVASRTFGADKLDK